MKLDKELKEKVERYRSLWKVMETTDITSTPMWDELQQLERDILDYIRLKGE